MAGCFEDLERHIAERDALAVMQRTSRELRIRESAEGDLGAGRIREFEMSREKVGVKMRVDHKLDRDPVFLC